MYRILFYRLLDDLAEEQIRLLEDEIRFRMYTAPVQWTAEQQVRWAEKEQMDAIVCLVEEWDTVTECEPSVPVIPVRSISFDTCVILYLLKKRLRQMDALHMKKVLLATDLTINVAPRLLNEMFDMEVYQPVMPEEATQAWFDSYAAQGYQIVVCNPMYIPMVERAGMMPFHDNTAGKYMNFSQDVKHIIQQIDNARRLRGAMDDLRKMVDYSFEAICTLDREGKIVAYNEKARDMFAISTDNRIRGSYFPDLVPALDRDDLDRVLSHGKSIYGRCIQANRQIGMLNITPGSASEGDLGAVVHFTTIQQIEEMESQVKSEIYRKGHYAKYSFADIKGESAVIEKAKHLADRFAKYNSNILIYGESGSGKELFAQGIHNASLRANQPFVAVNCGSLPASLLESELFGYAEGAFTGALKKGKKGLFEIANKGTIFLDEISEMGIEGQIRLLRVLEERCVMRVGDDQVIPVDVRVIAASNRRLLDLVKEGKFREDLYYRLNVLTLDVPPLRERGDDIVLIAKSFIKKYGGTYHKQISLMPEAERLLLNYTWDGNVRQLRNFCERLVIVADDYQVSGEQMQELLDMTGMTLSAAVTEQPPAEQPPETMKDVTETEAQNIRLALKQAGGNREKTAALLGISKATLWRKMKAFGIE